MKDTIFLSIMANICYFLTHQRMMAFKIKFNPIIKKYLNNITLY